MNGKNKGQVMLLTVLVLGGVILGVSTVAGLLMIYQLRQASDVASSVKAVFAADAGIEWELYRAFKGDYEKPAMGNGADFTTSAASSAIKSVGTAGRTSRAFELTFNPAP